MSEETSKYSLDLFQTTSSTLVSTETELIEKYQTALRLALFKQYCENIKKSIADGEILTSNIKRNQLLRHIDAFLLGSASERIHGI